LFSPISEYGAVGSVSVLGIEGHGFESRYSENNRVVMAFTFFFFLNLISSLVFTVYNPVYAAFFLIMTFFFAAILI
jgi:NADH:ubiquinone oxidoreductase subunit 6 (subunit J)